MNSHRHRPVIPFGVLVGILTGASVAIGLHVAAQPAVVPSTVDVSRVERIHPAQPTIPDRTLTLTDFGAIGDGKTMNTEAFRRAITAVEKAGGGKLIVPKGIFRTAPIQLCSNLELHLEEGAVIQAPDTFEALGIANPAQFKTQAEADAVYHFPDALITGNHLHDVAITGLGTIDGSGEHWWACSERAARAVAKTSPGRIVYRRPHLVVISECDRLLISDITLTNSSMFHLVPKHITDLTIERVKVRAPSNAPNTDAIDPGPVTRAWIHHCDIDTGDDDIVIKSGGTDVLIEDCTIHHGHGISIGSETTAGIHSMLVRRCTFSGTDNGLRIKSMRGAGGIIENVRYTDIQMKGVEKAIILQLDYVDNNRPNFKGDPSKLPVMRNILFDHITIEGSRNAGIIHGLPDSPIRNITFRDMAITAEKDFDIRDADNPVFENVTGTIKPGVVPAKIPGEY